MTTDILLSIALAASLILNAMQASKAQEWRNKLKELVYQIDLLTRPIEDDEAVHLRPSAEAVRTSQGYFSISPDDTYTMDDWLTEHPGPQSKPGYERKQR